MRVDKAVPVVLRGVAGHIEILMFRHPKAGIQLVKDGVEAGEEPVEAALRELREESGIDDAGLDRSIGHSTDIAPDQRWHFHLCRVPDLPDRWTHHASDDGGLAFQFFWQPLGGSPPDHCHPIYLRALAFIRSAIAASGESAH